MPHLLILLSPLLIMLAQVQAPAGDEVAAAPPAKVAAVKAAAPVREDHASGTLLLPALPHGKYILDIPETGDATVTPAGIVKLVGPSPGPSPDPTPTPTPTPDLSALAKAIKATADKATGDPKGAGRAIPQDRGTSPQVNRQHGGDY